MDNYFKVTSRTKGRLFRETGHESNQPGPSVTSTPTASTSKQIVTQDPLLSPLVSNTGPNDLLTQTLTSQHVTGNGNNKSKVLSQQPSMDECDLDNWGLYPTVLTWYHRKGVTKMFEWQKDCLKSEGVLAGKNLVFSAPTSAGKTMVGDILMMKQVFENRKKVLVILPLVSVVHEKMLALQSMLKETHIKVGGFMANHHTPGGFDGVDVAICTFEKANNYVVKLIAENRLDVLGGIIVDEAHTIAEGHRGHILELLLSKVLTYTKKMNLKLQIVAMSATLPNLSALGKWLDATVYQTDFRPVELRERIKIDRTIYDAKDMKVLNTISDKACPDIRNDSVFLAVKSIIDQHSVLIFYNNKAKCEELAQQISTKIGQVGKNNGPSAEKVRGFIIEESVMKVLDQLDSCPIKADEILKDCVKFGVAFHHAGLCMEHREIIEKSFRNGLLRVLVATSTLSSGVNLPARVVLIKTPCGFNGSMMDPLMYRQMIGRAGRKGLDEVGESILLCTKDEKKVGEELIQSAPNPVRSRLFNSENSANPSLQRAILECICTGLAKNDQEIDLFLSSTFHYAVAQDEVKKFMKQKEDAIEYLLNFDFIQKVSQDELNVSYEVTQLGRGCVAAAITPPEGLKLVMHLKEARKGLVLNHDLHLLYLIIPESLINDTRLKVELLHTVIDEWKRTNIMEYYTDTMAILGINVEKIYCMYDDRMLDVKTKKFFLACILNDIISEKPLHELDKKYGVHKSKLQTLQTNAAAFANMVASFSNKLGWHNIELLLNHLQTRLEFGVQRELIDLMHINCLNSKTSRLLYEANLETVQQISHASIEKILKAVSSAKVYVGTPGTSRATSPDKIWVESKKEQMTFQEFATLIQSEAREIIERVAGASINWDASLAGRTSDGSDNESFRTPKKRKRKSKKPVKRAANNQLYSLKSLDSNHESIVNATRTVTLGELSICQNGAGTPHSSPFANRASQSMRAIPGEKESSVSISPRETIRASPVNNEQSEAVRKLSQEFSQVKPLEQDSDALSIPEMCSDDDLLCMNLPFVETDEKEKDPMSIQSKQVACSSDESIELGSDFSSADLASLTEAKSDINTNKRQMSSISSVEWQEEKKDAQRLDETPSSDESSTSVDKRQLSGSIDTSLHVRKKVRQYTGTSISEKPPLISPKDKVQVIDCKADEFLIEEIMDMWIAWKRLAIHFEFTKEAHQATRVIGLKMGAPLPPSSKSELISFEGKKLEAVFLSFGDKNVYCFTDIQAINALADSFQCTLEQATHLELVVENVLQAYNMLRVQFNLTASTLRRLSWFDIKIACWLHEPEAGKPNFPVDYIRRYLDPFLPHFTTQKNKEKSHLLNALSSSLMVHILCKLEELVLSEAKMLSAYKQIEMKAALALAESQLHGFRVDSEYLMQLNLKLSKLEDKLEKKAYEVAGTTFNLESPKQVAEILYFKLNLLSCACDVIDSNPYRINKIKASKKLPDHLATKKAVLLKLAKHHELPKIICDHRSVVHARSQTVTPMMRGINTHHVEKSDRITGKIDLFTATGRISMFDPDLMKTPKTFTVFNDQVINVRKLLTAAPGFTLISADYSQLEMRILAHLSNDIQLIDTLNSGADVFKELAARIDSCDPDEVSDERRQQAKGISYGIIYGIGKRELSERLGVSEEEALDIKDAFLNTLKDINPFIEKTIEKCKQTGYIETMGGRRRYLHHISSHKNDEVSKASRQAINSTIQGSAADLAKAAMVKVDAAVEEAKIEAYLTLNMHDELIYQVKCDSLNAFSRILSECMQQVTHDSFPDFRVKLPVNLKTGPNWGEMSALDPDAPSVPTANEGGKIN